MPSPSVDLKRYRRNRQAEIDSAAVYDALATAEPRATLADVYRRLAATERAHAQFWTDRLQSQGIAAAGTPSWRARTLRWLVRRFGPGFVLPTLIGAESADSLAYGNQPESAASELPAQEQSHRRVLAAIRDATPNGMQ